MFKHGVTTDHKKGSIVHFLVHMGRPDPGRGGRARVSSSQDIDLTDLNLGPDRELRRRNSLMERHRQRRRHFTLVMVDLTSQPTRLFVCFPNETDPHHPLRILGS